MPKFMLIIIICTICITIPVWFLLGSYLKEKLFPGRGIKHLWQELPFFGVLDDGVTLTNKNRSYTRTLEVQGVDTYTMTNNEYESFVTKRHNMLLELAKHNHVVKMITTREILSDNHHKPNFSNKTAQQIAELSLQNNTVFNNKHYLSLTVLPQRIDLKNWLLDRLQGKKTDLSANLAKLKDACENIAETLPHEVKTLSIRDQQNHLLQFWSRVATGNKVAVKEVDHALDKWLSNSRVDFDYGEGLITQTSDNNKRYCKIISLNGWGDSSSGEILKEIISLPYEMTCLQQLKGKDKPTSLSFIKNEKKYRQSSKAQEELNATHELIRNDEVLMFEHQLSIFVFSNSLAELEKAVTQIRSALRLYELQPIVETTAIKYIYFQLFPGNEQTIRATHLLSSNVAHMLNFHSDEPGILTSDWCNHPIAVFKTASGTYNFSFHRAEGKEQPANLLISAPIGSGKTVLLNYLTAMSSQVKGLQAYVFDRYYGCKITCHAFGGVHVDLNSNDSNINIFCCDDTMANRVFLTEFLLNLAWIQKGDQDYNVSKQIIRNAVDGMFKVPKENRLFSVNYDGLIPKSSSVYQKLYEWGKGRYSKWISGFRMIDGKPVAFDALQFGSANFVVLEMTTILDSNELVILCDYIFHRIRTQFGGNSIPHLIAIDEAAQLVKHSIIKTRLQSMVQESRKSRGSNIFCFQDPASIYGRGSSEEDDKFRDAMVNNINTQILAPNPRADKDSYAPFKLKDQEWEFIQGRHRARQRLKRPMLIRKDTEKEGIKSSIIDTDLSLLGKYIHLLRSGGELVEIFNKTYQKEKNEWVEKYLAQI